MLLTFNHTGLNRQWLTEKVLNVRRKQIFINWSHLTSKKYTKRLIANIFIPFKSVFIKDTFWQIPQLWVCVYISVCISFLKTKFSSFLSAKLLQHWLWHGHSRTFTSLSWNLFCIALTLSVRSPLCWKINLSPKSQPSCRLQQVFVYSPVVHSVSPLSVPRCLYVPGVSLPDWAFCLQRYDSHVYVQRV